MKIDHYCGGFLEFIVRTSAELSDITSSFTKGILMLANLIDDYRSTE